MLTTTTKSYTGAPKAGGGCGLLDKSTTTSPMAQSQLSKKQCINVNIFHFIAFFLFLFLSFSFFFLFSCAQNLILSGLHCLTIPKLISYVKNIFFSLGVKYPATGARGWAGLPLIKNTLNPRRDSRPHLHRVFGTLVLAPRGPEKAKKTRK